MSGAWLRLGLRGRLAFSIAAIVLAAFAVLYVSVRSEMDEESAVIRHEEQREAAAGPRSSTDVDRGHPNELSRSRAPRPRWREPS